MEDFIIICHDKDCGDDNLMHAHLHWNRKKKRYRIVCVSVRISQLHQYLQFVESLYIPTVPELQSRRMNPRYSHNVAHSYIHANVVRVIHRLRYEQISLVICHYVATWKNRKSESRYYCKRWYLLNLTCPNLDRFIF